MNKIKVIIIEGNTEERKKLESSIVEDQSFELLGCTYDGLEGYKMIMEHKPDVVILDLILPSLDGIGIMQKIKMDYVDYQKPKFIVYSSISDETVQQYVNKNWATYYMIKPCMEQIMLSRIKQLFQFYYKNQIVRMEDNYEILGMEEQKEKLLEEKIESTLLSLGLKKHRKSYIYIREAVLLCIKDMSLLNGVTKVLYPQIAYKFSTNGSSVERAIRYGITNIWDKPNNVELRKNFSFQFYINNKPSNVEFIATISDCFRQAN